jgi:hypothetical protein
MRYAKAAAPPQGPMLQRRSKSRMAASWGKPVGKRQRGRSAGKRTFRGACAIFNF